MSAARIVGMAEIKVCREPDDVLIALGLGSCVGICAYDAHAGVAGLAHIVLPGSPALATGLETPGKFADTALPVLLAEMLRMGACPAHIIVALIGGAQLFSGTGIDRGLDIGPRNGQAAREQAACQNLRVIATDLGGTMGRTIHFFGNGLVRVKTLGQGERSLVDLHEEGMRQQVCRENLRVG